MLSRCRPGNRVCLGTKEEVVSHDDTTKTHSRKGRIVTMVAILINFYSPVKSDAVNVERLEVEEFYDVLSMSSNLLNLAISL